MVGLIAFEQVLRLSLRRPDGLSLEWDLRGHLFLNRPANATRLRVPFDVVTDFQIAFHELGLHRLKSISFALERKPGASQEREFAYVSNRKSDKLCIGDGGLATRSGPH